jgi:hypothetical protein
LFVRSDLSERCTIAHARIERATVFVKKYQTFSDPFCRWQWQRIKAKTFSPSKTHGNLQFVKIWRVTKAPSDLKFAA